MTTKIKIKRPRTWADKVGSMEDAAGFPVVGEHRFHEERRWRFDFAIVEKKIAIEVEGGVFVRGAHNRPMRYIGDMEKYNEAQIMGWKVLRYEPSQFSQCLADLRRLLR